MTDTGVKTLIMETCDLPTIPAVALKILDMVSKEKTTAPDLQRVIEKDAGLAGRVLKISNSALYGCKSSITNISTAIMVMGFSTLKTVVIAAASKGIYKRFGMTEKFLWDHSIVNGLASRAIAEKAGFKKPTEAFLSGLLHDIGKAVINNSYPTQYQKLMSRVLMEGLDFAEAEEAEFGFNHLDVGGLLARKWNFPEEMCETIKNHHDFEKVDDPYIARLSAIVDLANAVSRYLGVGGEYPGVYSLEKLAAPPYLGIGVDYIMPLAERVRDEYLKEKEALTGT